MATRASIVGAAATHVGKVREHNEDAHFFDADRGVMLVCDGMGGHAAGEVASLLAIQTLRSRWCDDDIQKAADAWLASGTADAKKQLLRAVREGVMAAHAAIVAEATRDATKKGMGTTLVGGLVVGGELVFAHAGDSRAYIVRDGIAMQLTEDQTLLSRLLAAGIDVDTSGEGSRFRSMLTNALGIGDSFTVSTFVVPLADGDRFMLCSDGISEYVTEAEVGQVLTSQPSPARAAQKLVDLALERGGGDNATAIVARVLEAGETPVSAEQRRRDDLTVSLCELWGTRISPQQRLRALRIAIPRDYPAEAKLPAHTLGDRVAWIVVEGELVQHGELIGPSALVYPESLIATAAMPTKDELAVAKSEVRVLALRSDDFREVCDDDTELGEALLESLAAVIAARGAGAPGARFQAAYATTDPAIQALVMPPPAPPPAPPPDNPIAMPRLRTEPEIETIVELVADEPQDLETPDDAAVNAIADAVTQPTGPSPIPTAPDPYVRKTRAVTSNDGPSTSGTIGPRRAKRSTNDDR